MANMERYFKSKSPDEKYNVSMEIVDSIHHSYRGRFLKRGNRCWVPVDSSEARTKVAHAIQYQRRKQLKLEKGLTRQNGVGTDFSTTGVAFPKPAVSLRHMNYSPNSATFDTDVKGQLDRIDDRHCRTYTRQQLARIDSKSPKQRNNAFSGTKVSSSLLSKSIGQAPGNATSIATCGKSTYSLMSNSLSHMMINLHNPNYETNDGSTQISTIETRRVGATRQQKQAKSSVPTTTSVTSVYSTDTSGVFSLTDVDSVVFEPDESTVCPFPL
jgi:hypothetical protein